MVKHPTIVYSALLYFEFAYCVRPHFDIAYCVPFNNKTTMFGVYIYIKTIKIQSVVCTGTTVLVKVSFVVFMIVLNVSITIIHF